LGLNLQFFAQFSSLDITEIVSYSGITVWTRFQEHRVLNAALAAISPVAVVTCLSCCRFDMAIRSGLCVPDAPTDGG